MQLDANLLNSVQKNNAAPSRQGFEVIGGELGKLINEIINYKESNFIKSFAKENESIIKNSIREILDIVIQIKKFVNFFNLSSIFKKGMYYDF